MPPRKLGFFCGMGGSPMSSEDHGQAAHATIIGPLISSTLMRTACDIAIVGGGAAGLTSAIFAGQFATQSLSICVLEGAKTFGTKILVSGGGRCNVTHHAVHVTDFNGSTNSIKNILAAFPAKAAVDWFASIGVQMKQEETGKLFPITDSARTVLNAMLGRCDALHIQRLSDHRVTGVRVDPEGVGFVIDHSQGELHCQRLILATGGRSLPRSGSDGQGWKFAESLGHTVTIDACRSRSARA